EWVLRRGTRTSLVPPREFSRFELSRYLDYCSEMLAITGKIAALYIQHFDDDVALAAVNEVETLTAGLSGQVWHKLTILYGRGPGEPKLPTHEGSERVHEGLEQAEERHQAREGQAVQEDVAEDVPLVAVPAGGRARDHDALGVHHLPHHAARAVGRGH